jgi:hypothetical protein
VLRRFRTRSATARMRGRAAAPIIPSTPDAKEGASDAAEP